MKIFFSSLFLSGSVFVLVHTVQQDMIMCGAAAASFFLGMCIYMSFLKSNKEELVAGIVAKLDSDKSELAEKFDKVAKQQESIKALLADVKKQLEKARLQESDEINGLKASVEQNVERMRKETQIQSQAIVSLSAKIEASQNAMEASQKSVESSFSAITSLPEKLEDGFSEMSEKLDTMVNNMKENLEDVKEEIVEGNKEAKSSLGSVNKQLMSEISDEFASISKNIQRVVDNVKIVSDSDKELIQMLKNL